MSDLQRIIDINKETYNVDNCAIEDVWMKKLTSENDILSYYHPWVIYFQFFFYTLFFIFGVFGNITSSIIWLLPELRRHNNSSYYLSALGITDAFVIIGLSFSFLRNFLPKLDDSYLLVHETLNQSFQFLSVLLVLAFTVERWISVCFPFKRRIFCSTRKTILTIVFLTVVSLVFGSHVILGVYITFEQNKCVTLFNELLFALILPFAILLLNIKVILEMKRMTQKPAEMAQSNNKLTKESQNFLMVTTMLVALSIYIIICSMLAGAQMLWYRLLPTPNSCLTIQDLNDNPEAKMNRKYVFVVAFLSFISSSHYAFNCVVYLITNQNFRRKVYQIFCWRLCRMIRPSIEDGTRSNSDIKTGSKVRENKSRILNRNVSEVDKIVEGKFLLDGENDFKSSDIKNDEI